MLRAASCHIDADRRRSAANALMVEAIGRPSAAHRACTARANNSFPGRNTPRPRSPLRPVFSTIASVTTGVPSPYDARGIESDPYPGLRKGGMRRRQQARRIESAPGGRNGCSAARTSGASMQRLPAESQRVDHRAVADGAERLRRRVRRPAGMRRAARLRGSGDPCVGTPGERQSERLAVPAHAGHQRMRLALFGRGEDQLCRRHPEREKEKRRAGKTAQQSLGALLQFRRGAAIALCRAGRPGLRWPRRSGCADRHPLRRLPPRSKGDRRVPSGQQPASAHTPRPATRAAPVSPDRGFRTADRRRRPRPAAHRPAAPAAPGPPRRSWSWTVSPGPPAA